MTTGSYMGLFNICSHKVALCVYNLNSKMNRRLLHSESRKRCLDLILLRKITLPYKHILSKELPFCVEYPRQETNRYEWPHIGKEPTVRGKQSLPCQMIQAPLTVHKSEPTNQGDTSGPVDAVSS